MSCLKPDTVQRLQFIRLEGPSIHKFNFILLSSNLNKGRKEETKKWISITFEICITILSFYIKIGNKNYSHKTFPPKCLKSPKFRLMGGGISSLK